MLSPDNQQLIVDAATFNIDRAARLLLEAVTAPSAVYRPTLSIDGNQWCALYGANLQDGVAGFGETPEAAMRAFDKAWSVVLTSGRS